LACATISRDASTPATCAAMADSRLIAVPGPNPTSSTVSFEATFRSSVTQPPQASFARAMMTPPNLPRKPRGWPNIRLKRFCIICIGPHSPRGSIPRPYRPLRPGALPKIVPHSRTASAGGSRLRGTAQGSAAPAGGAETPAAKPGPRRGTPRSRPRTRRPAAPLSAALPRSSPPTWPDIRV